MYFDIAMPFALLGITLVSLFLSQKVESRLRVTFEEKQFAARDAVLLVISMGAMVSLVALSTRLGLIDPIMILFLFSYSALLFMFTYLFSHKKWYLAVVPPTVFILLYFLLKDTLLWSLYLSNIYGVVFAILITLYMTSLFTWKSTWIFTILIVIADIVLVFVTTAMVEAARVGIGLRLPIAIILPIVPLNTTAQGDLMAMVLGLGDFFFAGLLSTQMFKKYGKKSAILSVLSIAVAFFIFEIFWLNSGPQAFPATLIIILGWLPIALWKSRRDIRNIQLRKKEK
jgi:hypothetical protein